MTDFEQALSSVQELGTGTKLTSRISTLERRLRSLRRDEAVAYIASEGITDSTLAGALVVKAMAGQINVVVHAIGILASLPYVLHSDEVIESLSLGAGNTGRSHDLETTKQIAEFKFIEWRGGPESIRQNSLFVDVFNLATADTRKRRVMYVVDKEHPLRFLNNRRAISSVLSKNRAIEQRFTELYGTSFNTVREYYESVKGSLEIVDLRDVVPAFAEARDA